MPTLLLAALKSDSVPKANALEVIVPLERFIESRVEGGPVDAN